MGIPIKVSREINILWARVSKADERSSRISHQHMLLFKVDTIVSEIPRPPITSRL